MTLPFENDSCAITKKLAIAHLKRKRLQKNLSKFAILLSAVLMTVVLFISAGIIEVNQNDSNSLTGSYHAMLSGIRQTEYERIRQDERIESLGITVPMGVGIEGENRINLSYSDQATLSLNGLTITEGDLPIKENEILIEKDYLDALNLNAGIGDTVLITLENEDSPTEYTISGFLQTTASGTNRILYAGIVSEQNWLASGGWETHTPTIMFRINGADNLGTKEMEQAALEITKDAGIEKTPLVNSAYLSLRNPSFYMIGVAAVVIAVILIASILVIHSIFHVSILNEIHSFGQFRTIGMTTKQIKSMVLKEGSYLWIGSAPIGVVLGTLIGYILIPSGFRPFCILWIWPFALLLTFLAVRFSVRKPAKIAASISPIEAMKYDAVIKNFRSSSKIHRVSPHSLAVKQIRRHRKKNILTVASLVLTGILLIGCSSVLSSIRAEDMAQQGFPNGQFLVRISNEELINQPLEKVQANNPLTNSLKDELMTISGLETIREIHNLPVAVESSAMESDAAMVGFEASDLSFYQSVSMDSEHFSYQELVKQNGIIVGRPDDFMETFHTEPQIGQTLSLKVFNGNTSQQATFTIMGILDSSRISDQDMQKTDMLLLPVETMQNLVNCSTVYEYQIRVSDEMETQAETELRQILQGNAGVQIDTLSAAVSEAKNFLIGFQAVLLTAIALLGCFAVLNLSNTILTGIIARRKEFSLFRSVGMTYKQLSAMVQEEGLVISISGLIISILAGGGIGMFLCNFLQRETMSYLNYHFPVATTAIFAIIILGCTILITTLALYQQRKRLSYPSNDTVR